MRPAAVEVNQVGDGEFLVRLPAEYAGKIELNCSTGTVVNYKGSEVKKPTPGNNKVSRDITD